MNRMEKKAMQHARRKRRVRKKVSGTSEKPRLSVFRSHKHIYAQVIDDTAGRTIVAASSLDRTLRERLSHGGNREAASAVGEAVAGKAVEAGVKKVVFDRNGFPYHGRVRELADAARKGGLEF
ncbi:MAG: 50S ribosomal protein L18 [Phycisphaerae bacterium]